MGKRHIILRGSRATTRDIFLGPRGGAAGLDPTPVAVSVEVADIDKRELAGVTREADVVAVAPAVPMKLVAPVDVPGIATPAASGTGWGITAVGADTSPFTGNGVVVAVLDTGIDKAHAAFSGVTLVEKDFSGEGNGDIHGHGTHCAGTIFGRDTNGSRIGVARGVNKALIGKVLGARGGSSDEIVNAIQWAVQNGAHVLSMSLGIDFPGLVAELVGQGFPPALATTRALEGYRANVMLFERLASLVRAQSAFLQPTVIVAAAGNESERNTDPNFEIAVSPPAVSEGIISVAALAEGAGGFTIASFSNTGAQRLWTGGRGAVREARRRPGFHEWHQHGVPPCRGCRRPLGREDQGHRAVHGGSRYPSLARVGCDRQDQSRVRPVRCWHRDGAGPSVISVAADASPCASVDPLSRAAPGVPVARGGGERSRNTSNSIGLNR